VITERTQSPSVHYFRRKIGQQQLTGEHLSVAAADDSCHGDDDDDDDDDDDVDYAFAD